MNLQLATAKDQGIWDGYVLAHPDGLAYHQYAWRQAVEKAYGFSGFYLMALEEGTICGVLPLVDFRTLLFGRKLVSLPYCDVGGVLADSIEVRTRLLEKARQIALETKAASLEIRFGQMDEEITATATLANAKVRMVLDLPPSSDALMGTLKSKLRSQVRKPLRDGLTARLGGHELVDEFYGVFCQNMKELGSPVHSRKWIQTVIEAFGANARVGMVYAPDGSPAAGGIILLHNHTVTVPWASSLRSMNRLNPNMLLYWTFLSFAADQGYRKFDFGRSTPGEGTYRFKEQWGAIPVPLGWQVFKQDGSLETMQPGGAATSKKRALAEALWQRLPVTACNMLGPLVRRRVAL